MVATTPKPNVQPTLPTATEQELIALWPSLSYEARNLYFKILDALLPEDAPIFAVLEDLEDIRAYDAVHAEGGEIIPFEQVKAEIQRQRT